MKDTQVKISRHKQARLLTDLDKIAHLKKICVDQKLNIKSQLIPEVNLHVF